MIDKSELNNMRDMQFRLAELKEKLAEINAASLVSSPQPSASHGSGISDRVADRGNKAADLECRIAELEEKLHRLTEYIETIPDVKLRKIVRGWCVQRFSWKEIAALVGSNENSVRKRYCRYVEEMS